MVHNVIAISDEMLEENPGVQNILDKLTTPEQAAEVFKLTSPKLAVFSHIVTKDILNENLEKVLVGRTRDAGYIGPLVLGKDGMVIEIAEHVKFFEPRSVTNLPILDDPAQVFPEPGLE
jgi:ribonuclease Z